MADYQNLYALLFNAVTDAVRELDSLNVGRAKELLVAAQREAEERYIESEEN